MSDVESLAGCFGDYGHSITGILCELCNQRELCRKVSEKFILKSKVRALILEAKGILRE